MYIFNSISNYWNRHGWTFIFIGVIAFFIFYYIFYARKNSFGTYTKPRDFGPLPELNASFMAAPKKKKRRVVTTSKGEAECKRCVEKITGYPFAKSRPDFMFNPVTKENLELDLFNYDLKIAIEYNGKQHYEYNSFMHNNSKDKFHAQQYRDRIKRDACKKLGIYLIEVPYTVKIEDIHYFLYNELKKGGYIY